MMSMIIILTVVVIIIVIIIIIIIIIMIILIMIMILIRIMIRIVIHTMVDELLTLINHKHPQKRSKPGTKKKREKMYTYTHSTSITYLLPA